MVKCPYYVLWLKNSNKIPIMWLKQCHKPCPSHHLFYGWSISPSNYGWFMLHCHGWICYNLQLRSCIGCYTHLEKIKNIFVCQVYGANIISSGFLIGWITTLLHHRQNSAHWLWPYSACCSVRKVISHWFVPKSKDRIFYRLNRWHSGNPNTTVINMQCTFLWKDWWHLMTIYATVCAMKHKLTTVWPCHM